MTVIEMPREPEKREVMGEVWTLDEMLGFLGDVADSKIKYGKCRAQDREIEIAFLMRLLWHRSPLAKTN
jgi:hypothetical protein